MESKKRLIIPVVALFSVLLIGGVFAVSTDTTIFSNIFGLGAYETISTEVFTSPSNWMTCESVPKTITLKNESNGPIAARVKYTEEWIASDKTSQLDLTDENGLRMAVVDYDNTNEWTLKGDGYYYYYRFLNPGETTSSFIKSVTLNCDANLSGELENYCEEFNGRTVCTSGKNPYADATYTLRASISSVQSDSAMEAWGYTASNNEATLLRGSVLANRMNGATKFVRVNSLPADFPEEGNVLLSKDISDGGLRASTESSDKPVYMWDAAQYVAWGGNNTDGKYEAGTVYMYSEANTIFYNPDNEGYSPDSLTLDIESLDLYQSFDASRVN
ncbi:MAG: BsaA family SipW-dependent biofilm matrix protein [Candidatus Saccharibacteria bacterium]|nr:BsaA family SipW-dependent biofilm matrix protein [Candidatus Saccharibacteria bacterium]